MAEESSANELEGLEKQIQCLLSRYSGDELRIDSEPFCSDFCKLVEEFASRRQEPLPQLRILEIALCYFVRASTFFTSNCDHVHQTISSLALSIFELLLFFDWEDFNQEPLKLFTATFQECHLVLATYQNVHLLQVERLVQGLGPWASPALQGILSNTTLPQNEVDEVISSELPVFFELRVRYLLSRQRVSEAMALAKCCAKHPTAGAYSFFLQVYLSWLYKTSQHRLLREEVTELSGRDAVHIICSLECEEKDELLLGLSTAFLSQQLCRGDMHHLCDLVMVWANLHRRLKTSKKALQEECQQLMQSATNIKSVFPFIRAILQEVGEEGIQFCVELCAHALQSCLPCDVVSKSLIYKAIAGLLPNDLEVCRTCALLVFFLERSVESYKTVYLLYMHPDQEYHVDESPIRNSVRFETLQVLKKDLYFDPEFWNLVALRTNCLKLLSEKVVSAALEEILEDKWISKYCTKEPSLLSRASKCRKGHRHELHVATKKRHHKEDVDITTKRLKMAAGKTRLNDRGVRRKGNQGSQALKQSSGALRRSFWQLDRMHSSLTSRYEDHRRTTRLSEKNPPKRRIRQPKWLLQDSGSLEENVSLKVKKNGLKRAKHIRSCVVKRSKHGQNKNTKLKPLGNSHFKAAETDKVQNGFSANHSTQPSPPQVILELSLPDNELMGSFAEDSCRPRGFPQVLLYKPTVKHPAAAPPAKPVHRKEVVLRARDTAMLIQLLHCYGPRQKGKGNGPDFHGSVSTITRSSVQGSPPKDPPGKSELKGEPVCKAAAAKDTGASEIVPKAQSIKSLSKRTSARADKVTKSLDSQRIPQAQSTGKVLQSIDCARVCAENYSAKRRAARLPQTLSAEAEVPNLHELPQIQSVVSGKEPCEEPAVEMKVTIASQSTVLDKVAKAPLVDQVSQATTAVKMKRKATGEHHQISMNPDGSNAESVDPVPSHSQNVTMRSGESGNHSVSASISTVDVTDTSSKESEEHVRTSPGRRQNQPPEAETSSPVDQASPSAISALTLVTEVVSELSPEQLAPNQENDKVQLPGSSPSKDSRGGSKSKGHHKTRTTSGCSTAEQDVSVVDVQSEKGKAKDPDDGSDSPESSELLEPESEESKLDFCCTFCNKPFKGSRVVAHAMFHFRKDECMFCGMMFKDDLLAMMHLSDHIEKLKRIKDQENGISDTKCTPTTATSSKTKTLNVSPGCGSKGRPKKGTPKPTRPSESRTLRSKDKLCDTFPKEKQSEAKCLHDKTAAQRVNGHISKEQKLSRKNNNLLAKQKLRPQEMPQKTKDGAESLEKSKDIAMDSPTAALQDEKEFTRSTEGKKKKAEPLAVQKMASKQNENVAEEKNVELQERVFCPVDGCSWCTDLSKNRVAILYHALDDHYGEIKPLELAFRVGNSKCSICMRVLWSFEHFQHHVERHRLVPRHPCLHQGCVARFKTGIEMRRHTRKHSPLQAVCCLPGCSKLFICLWALNLHEKDHYASKCVKPEKSTNVHKDKAAVEEKPHSSEDTTAERSTESVKAARKLRQQATHELEAKKNVKKPPLMKNEHKDSNVLTNLSNKDTPAQPAIRNLRLRQMLRKVPARNAVQASKVHKVLSSSKHKTNIKRRLEKKQVKGNKKGLRRKGRPPKLNKAVHDENTTAAPISTASNKFKEAKEKCRPIQDEDKATEQTETTRNRMHHIPPAPSSNQSVTSEPNAVKAKKSPAFKKHQTPSDSSKAAKYKTVKSKVNKKAVKKSPNVAPKKPSEPKSAVQQAKTKATALKGSADEDGTEESTGLTPNDKNNSVLAIPTEGLNASPAAKQIQKVKKRTLKKSVAKEGNSRRSASLGSSKVKKRNREWSKKKLDKENHGKRLVLKKMAKSKREVQQQEESKGKDSPKEEATQEKAADAALDGPAPSKAADVTDTSCPPANREDKPKKANVTTKSEASKASRKHKDGAKKRKLKETETLPSSPIDYFQTQNEQTVMEDSKSAQSKEALADYRKRSYIRPPPTAYLDERFITMPKKRKETPVSAVQHGNASTGHDEKAAALPRQRCANCFATFSGTEELQNHLQLNKCSSLFGFDSDDEGNSGT